MSFEPTLDSTNETRVGAHADHETNRQSLGGQPVPWKEGDRLNDFRLERLLGSGSSGVVYRAVDLNDADKRWALKLLRPDSPDDLLRNKLGFRKMMAVHHPNLVRVDRIHQLGSYVALSMEEVDGLTFNKARLQLQRLDPSVAYERLLSMLQQFASGLAAMHHCGLVHRDIKPANLMIRSDGVAKIIDYGLVDQFQFEAVDCKPRGFFFGTPRYVAPEVYWSQRYLPSGDIFGLGIVFLETLLATQKYARKHWIELARCTKDKSEDGRLISDAVEDLQDAVPGIIRDTCRQMLSRDPAERPTALELSRVRHKKSARIDFPVADNIFGRIKELEQCKSWADRIFTGTTGRLHISGPLGIGKSRLVEELIHYVESKNWGQVFRAQCRMREDQPMQAFDQLCDAIAARYMQGDREPLELDPVSATILKTGFPVLSNVLKARMDLSPIESVSIKADALEAAARLTQQLRLVGPLFLVIDDEQWADVSSQNAIDRLSRADGSEGLGIITVSRDPDRQRIGTENTIELDPLGPDESVELLTAAVKRWNIQISDLAIRKLAFAAGGNPFRLRELANEFCPSGSFAGDSNAAALVALESIDRLWERRADRLSEDAKRVLPFVATAGGRMTTSQLGELSGIHDSIDAAVSELVQQRLISDEATGGECIQIVHDFVAEEMTRSLTVQSKQNAHLAWACHLLRNENAHRDAGRIASHFFAAGQPGRALSHAILAAEDAETRAAMYQAAEWYKRIASHAFGSEKINHLRNSARCFREAEYPIESAACYQELADRLDDDERFECQLMAIALLIRGGRFGEVRSKLCDLSDSIGIPKPKAAGLARLAIVARRIQLAFHGSGALLARLTDQLQQQVTDPLEQKVDEPIDLDQRIQKRLSLCLSIVRPLAYFDNLYAAELGMASRKLLLKYPDTQLRFRAAVAEAVFAACDSGRKRSAGESQLAQLETLAIQTGNPRFCGYVATGISVTHGLAGRWSEVPASVEQSVSYYKKSGEPYWFQIVHTTWLHLWAMWHLGQWGELHSTSLQLYNDSVRRNDAFQQFIACSGYAAAGWLISDEDDQLEQIQDANSMTVVQWEQFQLANLFAWSGQAMRQLYQGRYDDAWEDYQSIKAKTRRMPFSSLQFVRILQKQLGALIALHQLNRRYSERHVLRASLVIDELCREATPYATMLANLYGGLLTQRISPVDQCTAGSLQAISMLATARDQAREQQLIPFQLAATDALHCIETGSPKNQLEVNMKSGGVVSPINFQNLFTVDFSR